MTSEPHNDADAAREAMRAEVRDTSRKLLQLVQSEIDSKFVGDVATKTGSEALYKKAKIALDQVRRDWQLNRQEVLPELPAEDPPAEVPADPVDRLKGLKIHSPKAG